MPPNSGNDRDFLSGLPIRLGVTDSELNIHKTKEHTHISVQYDSVTHILWYRPRGVCGKLLGVFTGEKTRFVGCSWFVGLVGLKTELPKIILSQ